MEINSSLEKEKKSITNFLPKALIEEINKNYDDKNHNKSTLLTKDKDINNIKPNLNINTATNLNNIKNINNINGVSMNNKSINLSNGTHINNNYANILYMNNIHHMNNNSHNINEEKEDFFDDIDVNNLNIQQYFNKMNKINGFNGIKNGKNGINKNINGINGINGNMKMNGFKNGINHTINFKNGFNNQIFGNNINNINQINFNNSAIYGNVNQIQNYNSFFDNTMNNSINIHLILPNENNYVNKGNSLPGNINVKNNINNINNNFILNNNIQFNNKNYNFINGNELSHSFNSNNINNLYQKLNFNNIQFNNNINNINNINSINNINNNNNNSININNNENIINESQKNKEKNKIEIDLIDSEIEEIFTEIYSLPSDKSQILFLIKKKGCDFFVKLIKTHKGSKHLQKLLTNNKLKYFEVNYITEIICKNFLTIICDYYGNYFLQKFFKYCSYKNRLELYKYIKPNFKEIANDICGNHSLQCLILLQNSKEERKIIKECVINDLKLLCFNQKSSHVIQKIIKAIKEKDRGYINTFIINNLINLCIDANGICIIKEFMNNIKSNYFILFIINCFEYNLDTLCIDQYGNFGIQEAIKIFGYFKCSRIIDNIINKFIFFSLKKYSSNVICFIFNYLKNKNFSKLFGVIKIIFNKKYFCIDNNNNNNININGNKSKKSSKNIIYQKLISNQYAIYIIFTIIQILNEVNHDSFNEIVINSNKIVNFKNNDNCKNNNFEMEDSDDDEDEKNSEENKIFEKEEYDNIEEMNYVNNCNNIPFDEFEKYKKGILLFIENNTQNKYKKKLINLMKINKIENDFITLKKSN